MEAARQTLPAIRLRPVDAGDRAFLLRVFAASREEELALLDWPDETKCAFVRMQFDAQDTWYRNVYRGARFDIVECDGEPVGRLYSSIEDGEMTIVDITLLPEHRNRGIGRALIEAVQGEAARRGFDVVLHATQWNAARRLYARLGFVVVESSGMHEQMRWSPQRAGVARSHHIEEIRP